VETQRDTSISGNGRTSETFLQQLILRQKKSPKFRDLVCLVFFKT
jgi:hypothetical protein